MKTNKTTQEEYDELLNELLIHRYRYYVLANPVISDYNYDMMERKLFDMEESGISPADNSPSQTIGSTRPSSYPKHIQEMFKNENHCGR